MGTLRVSPPGGTRLGGYYIPANTVLWVYFYSLTRNPRVWDAPDEFRPVRAAPTLGAPGWLPQGVVGVLLSPSTRAMLHQALTGPQGGCLLSVVRPRGTSGRSALACFLMTGW